MSAAAPARIKPTELMKACGSKTGRWEPESADQWRWSVKYGSGGERLLALIKLWSVARGSPWCVDDKGHPATTEDLCRELELKPQTVRNYLAALKAQGRIRHKKGRVWFRADVPEAIPNQEPPYSAPGIFPGYVIDFIKTLSPERQEEITAILEAGEADDQRVYNEAVNQVRACIATRKLNRFRAAGLPKRKLPKNQTPPAPKRVQLALTFLDTPEPEAAPEAAKPPGKIRGAKENPYSAQSTKIPGAGSVSLLSLTSLEGSKQVSRPVKSLGEHQNRPADRTDRPDPPQRAEGPSTPKESPREEKASRKNVEEAILRVLGPATGETPSPKLIDEVVTALGGAPVDRFAAGLSRKRHKAISMGFARSIAAEVGQGWATESKQRDEDEARRGAEERRRRDEARDLARATLDDPDASESEKKLALEILGGA